MEENKEILQVKDLAVAFQTYRGKVKAVRNVSFDLKKRTSSRNSGRVRLWKISDGSCYHGFIA